MSIIGTLPSTLLNGTVNDATQVMLDLNWIVNQVNANAQSILPSAKFTKEVQTATAGQTLFLLSSITYTPGINSLSVYVNGLFVSLTSDYLESSVSSVTFTSGLSAGDIVTFIAGVFINASVTEDASLVSVTPTGASTTNVQLLLRDRLNVSVYGAAMDGATDDSAAIVAMASAVGFVVIPRGNCYVGSNISVIGPMTFNPGAYITNKTGITLNVEGLVNSPAQWIFRGPGTVLFGGDPATNTYSMARVALAEWFGLVAGSGLDQIPALQLAVNAMGTTREGIIDLPMGTITANTTLTLNRGVKLRGKGSRRTVFSMAPDGVTGMVTGGVAGWLEGFQFDIAAGSYKNGGYSIDIQHQDWTVTDIALSACTQGIRLAGGNNKALNIFNAAQPSVLVAGSSLVDVSSSDCLVRGVMTRGTAGMFLESVVRIEGTSSGYSRVTVSDVDTTVVGAIAVNVVNTGANGIAQVNIEGVQQGGSTGIGVSVSNSGGSTLHAINILDVNVSPVATTGISISNSGAGSIQRVLIDGLMCDSGLATGISLSQTSGTLSFVKIGLCQLDGVTTPLSVTGTVSDLRIDPLTQTIKRTPAQSFSETIANNAVFVFATATSIFSAQVFVSVNNVEYGIFLMRAAATPAVVAVTTVSTNMASTTGVLTGTTGTAGKFTVSADASGNFYFENRLGSSSLAQITFMTGIQTIAL